MKNCLSKRITTRFKCHSNFKANFAKHEGSFPITYKQSPVYLIQTPKTPQCCITELAAGGEMSCQTFLPGQRLLMDCVSQDLGRVWTWLDIP